MTNKEPQFSYDYPLPSDESIKAVFDAFAESGIFSDEFLAICQKNDKAIQQYKKRMEKVDPNEFLEAWSKTP